EAGVKKFIFVSYWGLAKFGGFEHGKIKKMVEDLISVSGIDYTVLRVTSLATDMSLLLGKTLQKKGRSPVLMKKTERIRPILIEDLAWCIADTIENTQASNKIIEVAGEEEYTFLELQELFCKTIGRQVRFIFVPTPLGYAVASCIDFVTAQKYNARGLVSAFTGGSTCDITEMQKTFKLKQGSFARHLEDYFKTGGIVPQNPKTLS
ncbi:MAG: NmrA family NAD(P)-binding protein, partial [Deltaproteobacteria bacterium]|nr:NmrA family NAD(P)-binding protein [Deltaproteobacteria bacterium]